MAGCGFCPEARQIRLLVLVIHDLTKSDLDKGFLIAHYTKVKKHWESQEILWVFSPAQQSVFLESEVWILIFFFPLSGWENPYPMDSS